jgi:hypothetical protein
MALRIEETLAGCLSWRLFAWREWDADRGIDLLSFAKIWSRSSARKSGSRAAALNIGFSKYWAGRKRNGQLSSVGD